LLRRHGLNIPAGSPLERLALSLVQLNEDFFRQAYADTTADRRPLCAKAIGIDDLARRILSVADHPEFSKLLPHLRLLMRDNTGIVQNFFSHQGDATSNKALELYLGLLALRAGGRDLEMDAPDHSSGGNNPDVTFGLSSRRWGLAAKTMHTDNPKTYGDSVEKGVQQIERARVDVGVVVVNFKNILALDELWPVRKDASGRIVEYATYDDWREALALLMDYYNKRIFNTVIETWGGKDAIRDFWAPVRKALPATLNLLPTVVACRRPEGWSATRLNAFVTMPFTKLRPEDEAVLDRLNHVAQQE
jgi:hypothetical protein